MKVDKKKTGPKEKWPEDRGAAAEVVFDALVNGLSQREIIENHRVSQKAVERLWKQVGMEELRSLVLAHMLTKIECAVIDSGTDGSDEWTEDPKLLQEKVLRIVQKTVVVLANKVDILKPENKAILSDIKDVAASMKTLMDMIRVEQGLPTDILESLIVGVDGVKTADLLLGAGYQRLPELAEVG